MGNPSVQSFPGPQAFASTAINEGTRFELFDQITLQGRHRLTQTVLHAGTQVADPYSAQRRRFSTPRKKTRSFVFRKSVASCTRLLWRGIGFRRCPPPFFHPIHVAAKFAYEAGRLPRATSFGVH